jgi:hypothetical protein
VRTRNYDNATSWVHDEHNSATKSPSEGRNPYDVIFDAEESGMHNTASPPQKPFQRVTVEGGSTVITILSRLEFVLTLYAMSCQLKTRKIHNNVGLIMRSFGAT